jgi:hypothetical protein
LPGCRLARRHHGNSSNSGWPHEADNPAVLARQIDRSNALLARV